jgi:MOSC domain-containing protein YiiM
MNAIGRVASVNVSNGGVPKRPVRRAHVGRLGLDTDSHFEPEPTHGGPVAAVCLYSTGSIASVAADGHRAFPGAFGENLTLDGIEMADLHPGDRLAVGTGGLVLEVTEHSEPCQTIAHWFVERRIGRIGSKLNAQDARWYARVIVEGPVAVGDRVELEVAAPVA